MVGFFRFFLNYTRKTEASGPGGEGMRKLALDRAQTSPDLFAASNANIFGDAPIAIPRALASPPATPAMSAAESSASVRSRSKTVTPKQSPRQAEPSKAHATDGMNFPVVPFFS